MYWLFFLLRWFKFLIFILLQYCALVIGYWYVIVYGYFMLFCSKGLGVSMVDVHRLAAGITHIILERSIHYVSL